MVDDLATKVAQLVRTGIARPFVFVKLRDWLPYWASEGTLEDGAVVDVCVCACVVAALLRYNSPGVDNEENNMVQELARAVRGEAKPQQHHLQPFQWTLAFEMCVAQFRCLRVTLR